MLMRVRYPQIVLGSLASAAPVLLWGNPDLEGGLWYDTVAKIFQEKNATCARAVSNGFKLVVDQLSKKQFAEIEKDLNLCSAPSEITTEQFLIYLQHATQLVAQFEFPFKSADKVPFPFEVTCDSFVREENAYMAMRTLLDTAYNNTLKLSCFWIESGEQSELPFFTARRVIDDSFPASLHLNEIKERKEKQDGVIPLSDINFELSWSYICCSYFFMPVAGGNTSRDFFHFDHLFYPEGISDYCERTFSVRPQTTPPFDPKELKNTSNIMFSNMGFDPVKAFSIQQSVSTAVTLITIPSVGHTLDICGSTIDDHNDLKIARVQEVATIRKWLQMSSKLQPSRM
ncbi:hypothetical protein CYMTET_18560 [Cymbomonas tetramitiformis]|uniref:Uncharacterized protein n=1 Tax=Cymbomonas tetramitiformis TaxID=36881 RepID=A0AAE0G7T9_9CHLO|nr:hypothetical protein CYMTET_18560 [Cymbomonas tetramitiformis]